MSSNRRAILLAISGILVIFGLMSLSQAGYFVIRYFALGVALEPEQLFSMWLGFWRGFWLISSAILIHFRIKEIFKSRKISLFIMISVGLTGYSFLNI